MKLPTFFNLLLLVLLLCHYSDGGRKVIKSPRRPGKGNYVLRTFVGISKIFWNKKVQGNRDIQKLKPKKNISTLLESLRQGNKCGDKCLRKDRAILNEVDSAIGERLRTDRKGRRFRRSNSSVSCHMVFDRMRKKLFSGFIKTWMNWFSNGDNKFFRQNSYLAVDYKDGNCSRQLLEESGRTNKKKPRKRRRKKRALTLVDRTAAATGHPGFGGIGARRRGRSWSQRPRQPRLTGEGPSPYHWNDFRTAIRRRRDNNSQWQYQNRIRSASVKAAGGDIDVENESSFDNKVTNHVNPDGTRQFDRHTTASSKFKYSGDPAPGFSPSAMQFGGSNTFSGGGGNRVGTRGNMRVRFADQGPFHNYSVEHGHQFNMRNGMGSGGGIGGRPRGILKPSLRPNPVATFSLYQHQPQRRRPQQRRSNYVPSMPRPTAAGGYHGGYQGSYSAGGGQRSNYRSSFHHAHGPGGSDFEDYDDYSDSDGDEEDDDDDEDDEGEGYYAEGGHGMSYRGHHSNHMVVVHHGLRGMMRPAPAPHKSNTSKIVATVVVVFFILLCLL